MTTISDIYGQYGLTQNSTTDPFAQSEKTITDAVKKQLNENASARKEATVARGFDTSYFDNGQTLKQEGDILSNLYSTFAQNRLNNVNADLNLERNVVQNAAITETNTAANSQLSAQNYQQTVGVDAANAGTGTQQQALNVQSGLSQQQIDLQKSQLLGEYTTTNPDGSLSFSGDETQAAKQFAKQFGLQESAVTGIYTDSANEEVQTLAAKQLDQQKTINADMLKYYTNRDQQSFDQLMGYTDENGVEHEGTMDKQLKSQQDIIQQQYDLGELSADSSLIRQQDLIESNYDAQLKLFQDKAADQRANLVETLRPQFDNEMLLLAEKMRIEKAQSLEQIGLTFFTNLAGQGVNFLTSVGGQDFLGGIGSGIDDFFDGLGSTPVDETLSL